MKKLFSYYTHLGFHNPYFLYGKKPFIIDRNFSSILSKSNNDKVIDPVSIIELLNKGYIFGDRSLIKEIHRTPWYAEPNETYTEWKYATPPKHGHRNIIEEEIAITLFEKICVEIKGYIGDKKKIGVLLSGGMDSRMVAGAIDYLQKTGNLKVDEVTGLTWGNEGTRDVIYAKEITRRLGWKWKHYIVGAKELLQNIEKTAYNGCEYSPIHLHAIPQICDDNELDLILAGSYGDSVGRAEYSGRKVTKLLPINNKIMNVLGLINVEIYQKYQKYIKEDIMKYHFLFPTKAIYMQNEMDYELHYMRRMLNPCMELLTERSEFYQVFTSPDIFGYMWSITPSRRTDLVYKHMLKEFKTDLSDIPWSRTGLPYGQKEGIPDSFIKNHHSYAEIIHHDIFKEIKEMILSGYLKKLNIFNMPVIVKLLKLCETYPLKDLRYAEIIIWLASVAKMVEKYEILGVENVSVSSHSTFSLLTNYFLRALKEKIQYR
ncbi:asparagine synthase-related protein [Proteiniphilum acetatigenes]|uniref:asparagine synthase-related protein n=1 Tax=Proteiniphilum acetatigenes TaxID=294710 RepID=UPI0003746D86|nr:asparagine synthase-related protein [Proteiniphilum acetatigenes]